MTSKERLTVNLQADEYRDLQALSRTLNVSMAWLGRKAITELLQKNAQQELPLPFESERRQRKPNS